MEVTCDYSPGVCSEGGTGVVIAKSEGIVREESGKGRVWEGNSLGRKGLSRVLGCLRIRENNDFRG